MKKWILFIAILAASKMAFACDAADYYVLNMLNRNIITSIGKKGNLYSMYSVCKSWPQNQGFDIIATYYTYKIPSKINGAIYFGMTTTVADREKEIIKGFLDENKIFIVNEKKPNEVEIDTANYKVGNRKFLFGIRVSRQSFGSVNPVGRTFMNMYEFDGKNIKSVVSHLLISSYNGKGDSNSKKCEYSSTDAETSISIGNKKTNNYTDMLAVVNATLLNTYAKNKNYDCNLVNTKLPTKEYVLKFNGKHYIIPKQLQDSLN
jgi:hypothetical protein